MLAPLLIPLGCGRGQKSAQKVVDLYIETDGDFIAFKPDTLTCPTGALVRLTFLRHWRVRTLAWVTFGLVFLTATAIAVFTHRSVGWRLEDRTTWVADVKKRFSGEVLVAKDLKEF